ncbi:MAG: molybdenum cofactor guanylyltransferase [Flavobacteriaceae bacterium]|nr:molybdenum cofactor guanylyltransferase [Flavobacteriaceae bacterium]
MINSNKITGIILAGGKSKRMGRDKGFILYQGKTFLEHIAFSLGKVVKDISIVADNPDYDKFNYNRIHDVYRNCGPLGGLYSGLLHSDADYAIVLSCDVPLITTELIKMLIQEYEELYDVVQFSVDNEAMPLVALYTKTCLENFKTCLEKGEYKLLDALSDLQVKTIPIHVELSKCLSNINSEEDLASLP